VLASVQTQLAAAINETGRVCIPTNASPSTHILKSDAPRLWGGVQNEPFCLTLARRVKIAGPNTTTGGAANNLFTCAEIPSNECRRSSAWLAPGELLPSAWKAAVR
jgi:hypothetical protein